MNEIPPTEAEVNPEFRDMVRSSWCRETASPGCQEKWSPENPALGQCAVTALLVQDVLGGELMRTSVEGQGSHYYNRLPDGRTLDLTRGQFPEGTVIPDGQPVPREYVLGSERAVAAQTPQRYRWLKARFDLFAYAHTYGC